MNDLLTVYVADRIDGLAEKLPGLRLSDIASGVDVIEQIATFHQLHDKVDLHVDFKHLVDFHLGRDTRKKRERENVDEVSCLYLYRILVGPHYDYRDNIKKRREFEYFLVILRREEVHCLFGLFRW